MVVTKKERKVLNIFWKTYIENLLSDKKFTNFGIFTTWFSFATISEDKGI